MKKIILLLLVIGFHQSVFAKVLTVRRYGYGGAFWNIEQAVDSANTGDTVYIDLRNETQYWGVATIRKNITLSISDTSVSLNSLFIVTSTFKLENLKVDYLEFNGDNIEINQCTFQSGMEIKKGSCTINNSKMNYLMTYDTTSEVNLFNSFVTSNNGDGRCYLKGSNLSICGTVLGRELVINSKNLIFNGNSINNNSRNLNFRINSNKITFIGNDISQSGSFLFQIIVNAQCGLISNNLFTKGKFTIGCCTIDRQAIFFIGETKEQIDYPLVFVNNFLSFFYTDVNYGFDPWDSTFYVGAQMNSSNLVNLENNTNAWPRLDQFYLFRNSILNINAPNLNAWRGGVSNSNLVSTVPFNSFQLDNAYRLSYDSNLVINRGHDDPAFSDLDLSRNDIGPLGGPTPITNYQQTGGPNPRIWDVSLPRRTFYPSGSIPIRATGATK
jgi:hypothetical protein